MYKFTLSNPHDYISQFIQTYITCLRCDYLTNKERVIVG